MILRYVDSHICEEDTKIFHSKISNQFHIQEFKMQDYKSFLEIPQWIHHVLSVIP